MAIFWARALLLGFVAVMFASAFPGSRDKRQAEIAEMPVVMEVEEMEDEDEPNPLGLPANASALLPGGGPADESFSCDGRVYGYYADPANNCLVFHVCLPLQLPEDGPDAPPTNFRFSFICPEQTVFNQEALTCTRPEDSIPCEESPQWYHLNDKLGETDSSDTDVDESEDEPNSL